MVLGDNTTEPYSHPSRPRAVAAGSASSIRNPHAGAMLPITGAVRPRWMRVVKLELTLGFGRTLKTELRTWYNVDEW